MMTDKGILEIRRGHHAAVRCKNVVDMTFSQFKMRAFIGLADVKKRRSAASMVSEI